MTKEVKSRLNEEQQAVANHIDGPLQVVAGAGSGKTTVLMHRTQNIIENRAAPSQILLVTFTKKAANELKERLITKIGDQGKEVNAGTFHSICLQRILKRYADEDFLASVGLHDRWEGMDQKDQAKLIKRALVDMTDEDKEYCNENSITPKNFESFLSLVRSMGVKREDYQAVKKEVIDARDKDNPLYWINEHMEGDGIKDFLKFEETALRFWERYEQLCRSKNAIDFDDILLLSCQLVEENEDVAKRLSEEWKYIMLDEYQDTNIVQMRIMDSIAKHHQNICVVGDDQQSIYAFRGSNIGVIRGFKDRYPNTELLTLSYNYRSSAEILLASNRIAGAMPNRLSNEFLKTPTNKHNDRPELRGFISDYEEARWIAGNISNDLKSGTKPSDIAILYRNRSMKQSIEKHFLDNNLPYMIFGDTSFFDRKEVQDTVAMVRFIFRPWSALSAVRFMEGSNLPVSGELVQKNSEKRGVSPHLYLSEYARAANEMLGDNTLDTEDDKKKRFYHQANIVYRNLKNVADMPKGEQDKHLPKLLHQLDKVNDTIKDIEGKINDNYYSQGSIRKNEIQKSGTMVRKVIKQLKGGDINWEDAINNMSETQMLMKRSVNKSNEVRLFLDTMEAISDTAKICDVPGIDKDMVKALPRVFRDALASIWETYMASSLERHTKNRTASDKDHDNLDNRVRNVEYILDRFSEKIEEAIFMAENEELNFSEVVDVAVDDLVTLVDQAPDENALEKVQMMTMHASKGLEFKKVYLVGLIGDLMPGPNPEENPSRAEEELRLFYVGVTRAQEKLCMTYPLSRRKFSGEIDKCKPSRFLQNILDVVDYHKANTSPEAVAEVKRRIEYTQQRKLNSPSMS